MAILPTNPGGRHRRLLRDPLLFAILVLLVLDVSYRFSVATSLHQVAGTVDCPASKQQQSSFPITRTIIDDDAFNNTQIFQDTSCGVAWSLPGLLTGKRTTYTTTSRAMPSLGSTTTIHTTTWHHQRSGAPSATGTITAQISYCDEGPVEKRINSTTTTTTSSSSSSGAIVRKETVLCGGGSGVIEEDLQSDRRTTVVVEFGGNWDDVLGDTNLNMWHFHAAAFRMWVGVQIGQSLLPMASISRRTITIVLHAPAHVFDGFQYQRGSVLVASRLLEHLSSLGSAAVSLYTKTHLEGLQGVADVFQGRLLVTKSGVTTVAELKAALQEQGANPLVSQWIQPPNDGLFWDLAWDKRLRNTLSKDCRNSLLHQYRNDILGGLTAYSHGRNGETTILKRPPNQHVCFLSRQRRSRKGAPSRGSIRNLAPEFLLELLGNLGSPILLTPSTALRQPDTAISNQTATSRLLQVEKISIAEQMQYVYEECAVLLSVHGAGLTNALGMRPGTAVIELQSNAHKGYQYFANVAALMNQVSYTLVDTLDGDGPDHEENMHASNEQEMDRIYALVEQKLQESYQRQVELLQDDILQGT